MRMLLQVVTVLGSLLIAGLARAGLYLPPRHGPFPIPGDYRLFQLRLADHQLLATTTKLTKAERARNPEEEKQRKPILKEAWDDIDELEQQRQANTLSVAEGIRLGGYYLIVPGQVNKALQILKVTQEREPNNFMLLGNLATAYFRLGVNDRAVTTQEQMLNVNVWPREVPDWTPARLRWQRRLETFYLNFLRERAEASRLDPQPGVRKPLGMDNLFPGVRFLGRDGKFTAGEIDPRSMDRLPPDALPIVEQLILWLPEGESLGLLWLLAELFNAHHDLRPASALFTSLVDKLGTSVPELVQRRRLLQQAVEVLPVEKIDVVKPDETASPVDDPPSALPNWRTFGIGLGIGVLVGVLLLLQFQQLFRSSRR